eukprot:3789551-Ditylum_brightwellii.AAC.1
MYGEAHSKAWRTKGKKGQVCNENEMSPGDRTSTNQLVSGQPGLDPQISGWLTNKCITGATIYVDHATNLLYVHLMQSLFAEETLESKQGYERIAAKHGVTAKRYYSDNGWFGEKLFCNACIDQGQQITFCGVGAHHQNKISKNWIKQLTLKSCTMLLHAKLYWP